MTFSSPPFTDPPMKFHVHRIRGPVLLRAFIFFIVSVIGIVLSTAILIWRWQEAINYYGPAVVWRWISVPFWVSLFFLVMAISSSIILRRVRQNEVQLSNMGLTIQRGKRLETIAWERVMTIRTSSERYGIVGVSWGEKTEIHIVTKDGTKYTFNQSFDRIVELIEQIKHFVYPRLLEEYRLAFNRGEPLTFGPLVLTSDGILNGRKALRWKDLGKVNLEKGSLELQPLEKSDGPKLSLPAHKVPNIDLCIQLISHLSPQS